MVVLMQRQQAPRAWFMCYVAGSTLTIRCAHTKNSVPVANRILDQWVIEGLTADNRRLEEVLPHVVAE
jgi:hypothetical protein